MSLVFALGCNALLDIDHIDFGATSGQGASGGATSTGAMTGGEACTNGADDDADGDVDCADSDCGSFSCVEPPPDGWLGPVAFWIGAPGDAPTCAAGWMQKQTLHDTLIAPDASCAQCDCSNPQGGACGLPDTLVYSSTDCSGTPQTLTPTMVNDCDPFTLSGLSGSAQGEGVPVDDEGSCSPSGGAPTVVPATWMEEALLCGGAAGGGCASGVCVPAAPAPMLLCIYQQGNTQCPTGYTGRSVVHGDYTDDRGCSMCSCDAANGGDCDGVTTIHDGPGCGQASETVPNTGSGCHPFTVSQTANSFSYTGDATPSGGSCNAIDAVPTGNAQPIDTITVCCAS